MTTEGMEFWVWAWLFVGSVYYLSVMIALKNSGQLAVWMRENPAAAPIAVLFGFIVAWPLLLVGAWVRIIRGR